jgi:hypothetical protein
MLAQLMQAESRPPQWRYLAAGTAVAVLVIGAFFVIGRAPDSQTLMAASIETLHGTGGAPPAIASRHAILRTRGSAVDAEIPLPPAGQAIELRILPEFGAHPTRYRIQLFRMSADDSLQRIAELGGLEPAFDNFVTIFVDGARLQPGQYRLAIAGDPDTDARDKQSAFMLRMRPAISDPSARSR